MSSRDYQGIAQAIAKAIAQAIENADSGRIPAGGGSARPAGNRPQTAVKPVKTAIGRPGSPGAPDDATLRIVVDALWDGLHGEGVSWVGFYLFLPGEPADRAMVLGPSRDTPACSPIGLHGVCGQALTGGRTRIVRDVAELGAGYVACDPRDRSEIVLPCTCSPVGSDPDPGGGCWGVLDLDSHGLGAFDESDERGLVLALRSAGIGVVGS
jgi:putative methionine-R-sulfoxide reductase with GAF domain